MKILKNKSEGFTIIETLVTLLALSIMIAGPVTFVYKSYQYAGFIKQKILATGLSQEALELATSKRNYLLTGADSFQEMAAACTDSCLIDWNGTSHNPSYQTCTGEGCRLALIDDGNNIFSYRHLLGGTESDFYRAIKIVKNGTYSYTVYATTTTNFNGTDIPVALKKVFFNINIKD